jgi:hypothetical protein
MLANLERLPSAKEAVLFYLKLFVGKPIDTRELEIVSGIPQYARRIRELRVEDGYDIESDLGIGHDDRSVSINTLRSAEPDSEKAEQWRQANRIRGESGSASERMLRLFMLNIGKPLTIDTLAYVSKIKETRRRTSELRTERGYRILTRLTGRPDLRQREYVLDSRCDLYGQIFLLLRRRFHGGMTPAASAFGSTG